MTAIAGAGVWCGAPSCRKVSDWQHRREVAGVQARPAVTTHLFTDIQGSTRLWESEPERMREALARHDALTRAMIAQHGGAVVKMIGDGAQAVFDNPVNAVRAALELQRALADPAATAGLQLLVRCGLHAGVDEQRDNDFFGPSVNRTARIMNAAHGGQVLLSEAVAGLVADRLPDGAALQDLGAVRLRDLERREHVYQLLHPDLARDFAPLRSLEATPNNLPLQASSFVGRERELLDVEIMLGRTRLLTLLGPGGIGKTRLSLQAAADTMHAYPDGAWFVELAPLTDSRLVPQALASVLGVKEGVRSILDGLSTYVRDRSLLIILDNCEHVLQGCADLAARLLQSGSRVRILASSREPLRVAGETTYPLRPLSTPDPEQAMTVALLNQYEAARLFVQRVLAVQPALQITQPDSEAVATICQRLDGIPLALELAAGRARVLSLQRIAERLSDRFGLLTRGDQSATRRQQTLRASIDWSYELLTDAERMLLRRLSVFAGGWTLEAAEAVCAGGEVHAHEVLELLGNLVEKSLVTADLEQGRYRLLETVRQYAQERLEQSSEGEALRTRHLDFYVLLAEQADPGADRMRSKAWFAPLDAEWGNLLAAFDTCRPIDGGASMGMRLTTAVKYWVVARGYLGPGYRMTVEALARADARRRDLTRCRALLAAAELGFLTGCYREAESFAKESLGIAEELGDAARIAESNRLLGYAFLAHRQPAAARGHFDRSLELSRRLQDKAQLASALNALGELHRTLRQPDQARPLYEEAVALDRESGDRRRLAVHLCNLSSVLIESGLQPHAAAAMREALSIATDIGSRQIGHAVLGYCAGLAVLREDWPLATQMHGAAENQARRMGYHREPMDEAFLPSLIEKARLALGRSAFESAEAEGLALSYEQAVAKAQTWLARDWHEQSA
jgi:predicted ATPase/class 3 adenylate cyclase